MSVLYTKSVDTLNPISVQDYGSIKYNQPLTVNVILPINMIIMWFYCILTVATVG